MLNCHRPLQIIYLIGLAIVLPAHAQTAAVTSIGEYSSVRTTGEGCQGYAVDLWQSEGKLYGIFQACDGGLVDTRNGAPLEGVSYDGKSKAISFTASLSLGSDFHDGTQVPSQDVFHFTGTMDDHKLAGTLQHTDKVYSKPDTDKQKVQLNRKDVKLENFSSLKQFEDAEYPK